MAGVQIEKYLPIMGLYRSGGSKEMELQRNPNQNEQSSYRTQVLAMPDMDLRREIDGHFDLLLESIDSRTPCSCWQLNCCVEEYMARFKRRRLASAPRYRRMG
jgi:hypothetical protein